MKLGGMNRDAEPARNVFVRGALGQQRQHFKLARRKGRLGIGRGGRSSQYEIRFLAGFREPDASRAGERAHGPSG